MTDDTLAHTRSTVAVLQVWREAGRHATKSTNFKTDEECSLSDKKSEDGNENKLRLKVPRRIVLRKTVEGGSIQQNFSHGRSKSVVVEVRKKKTFIKAGDESSFGAVQRKVTGKPAKVGEPSAENRQERTPSAPAPQQQILTPMTTEERASFQKQRLEAQRQEEMRRKVSEQAQEEARRKDAEQAREEALKREAERVREEARLREGVKPSPIKVVEPHVSAQKSVAVDLNVATAEKGSSAPLEEEAPVSAQEEEPASVKREEPASVKREEPASAKKEEAVSAKGEESASVKQGEPGLAKEEKPASMKKESPPSSGKGGADSHKKSGKIRYKKDKSGTQSSFASPSASTSFQSRPLGTSGRAGAASRRNGEEPSKAASARQPEEGQAKRPTAEAKKTPESKTSVAPKESTPANASKKMTRAQREDVARKKTDALVAKRLSQLDEMRRQKQEVDEKRKLATLETAAPARTILKTNKVKRKGKKASSAEADKQVPVRRTRTGSGKSRFFKKEEQVVLAPVVREVVIPDVITVGELASRMAVKSSEVIRRLMAQGMMVTINQVLDKDTAALVVEDMGHKPKQVSEAAVIDAELTDEAGKEADQKHRAPVVTIMGHVDHGKTSLLDAIRKTDVASREFGGITQHIGAYQVTMKKGDRITFLDTPGHAAFTAMRARGAHVTDIVVLVVAADDGVMPQTLEALHHAKDAKVPIVVAINKMDKQGANPDRVTQQLSDHDLVPEDWGGDTIFVKVSAHTGDGIEELEEMILLQAEVLGLQANVNQRARGSIVEAKLDKGRGPVATCLVQNGTLRVGDIFVVGTEWGKIRGLVDDRGRSVSEALPSMPVEIIGFSGVPDAGDDLITIPDERRAKEIAAFRIRKSKEQGQAKHAPQMDDIFDQIQRGELNEVKVIIKGDVRGSVEAVAESLQKIIHSDVRVNVIHTGVGGVNESDIMLAVASDALIVGFNVRADAKSRELAKREKVNLRFYTIIYDLMDDITQALEGKLKPLVEETVVGRAKVRELFRISKVGLVAGCIVMDGVVQRKSKARLLRDNVQVYSGEIQALKRFKDDVKDVQEGLECGICLDKFSDIKENDVIEAFVLAEVQQKIDR